MRLASLLLALAALPAAAQPSAEAVVDAWAAGWRSAAEGVGGVEMAEAMERRLDGPRRDVDVVTEGRLIYRAGERPRRERLRARVDGEPVAVERAGGHDRRLGRAFGRGGRDLAAPPPLPSALFRRADVLDLTPDVLDGRAVWRVGFVLPRGGRGAAWFTRSADAPRLLRTRTEGGRREGHRITRDVAYAPVAGLDLPVASRSDLVVRQRRRLREYRVTMRAEARYADHRLLD